MLGVYVLDAKLLDERSWFLEQIGTLRQLLRLLARKFRLSPDRNDSFIMPEEIG